MKALVDRKFKRPVPISFSGISIGSPSLAFKAKTVDMKDSDNEINRYDLAQLASTSNKCIYIYVYMYVCVILIQRMIYYFILSKSGKQRGIGW